MPIETLFYSPILAVTKCDFNEFIRYNTKSAHKNQYIVLSIIQDGVGPVDNRSSTDKLHHFVRKKKKKKKKKRKKEEEKNVTRDM